MGEAPNPTAAAPPFSPAEPPRDSSSRGPMVIAVGVVLVILAAVILFTRRQPAPARPGTDPYLAKVEVSDLHMATAENFAGGSVFYILGKMTNTGDRKLTGAQMQVLFKNTLGETVDDPVLPVSVRLPNSPYEDYGPVDRAPLAPGRARDFRVTLEHVSADWDGQIPQLRLVSVQTEAAPH